jgi:hypothetical protein
MTARLQPRRCTVCTNIRDVANRKIRDKEEELLKFNSVRTEGTTMALKELGEFSSKFTTLTISPGPAGSILIQGNAVGTATGLGTIISSSGNTNSVLPE